MDLGLAFSLREPVGITARPVTLGPGPSGDGKLSRLEHPALLLDGVILRMVGLRQRTSAALHGSGDILPAGAGEPEPFAAGARILRPTRLIVLDPRTMMAATSVPALVQRITETIERQSTTLALQAILVQLTSIEERLELVLPELADRWGTVTSDGVVLPSFLSHTVLAALVGVRRPSLTTALAELSDPGLLRRLADRRWLVAPRVAGL